jgi:hypothetical protein
VINSPVSLIPSAPPIRMTGSGRLLLLALMDVLIGHSGSQQAEHASGETTRQAREHLCTMPAYQYDLIGTVSSGLWCAF